MVPVGNDGSEPESVSHTSQWQIGHWRSSGWSSMVVEPTSTFGGVVVVVVVVVVVESTIVRIDGKETGSETSGETAVSSVDAVGAACEDGNAVDLEWVDDLLVFEDDFAILEEDDFLLFLSSFFPFLDEDESLCAAEGGITGTGPNKYDLVVPVWTAVRHFV